MISLSNTRYRLRRSNFGTKIERERDGFTLKPKKDTNVEMLSGVGSTDDGQLDDLLALSESTLPSDDVISWFLLNVDMDAAAEFQNTRGFDMLESPLGSTSTASKSNNRLTPGVFGDDASITMKTSPSDTESGYASGASDPAHAIDVPLKRKKTSDTNKNRESAKENRKRQRVRIESLGSRVKALSDENEGLKAHILNVTQRKAEVQKHRMDMERMMARKVLEKSYRDEPENQEELQKLVQNFRDLYADYGAYRHKEVAYHLQQIEKLLLPSRVTKMAMWTLNQDSDFFVGQKSPFWNLLSKELDLTDSQVQQMQQHRHQAKVLIQQLKESLDLLKELKVAIENKHAAFDSECGKVEAVCNPKQSVLFLMWVTKNAEKLSKVIPDFDRTFPHVPVLIQPPVSPINVSEESANSL